MLFQFKTVPEDFIVEEVLHEEPQGEGEVLYLFFEKRAQTTMEIVEFL
ncbi:tRNA pseudouridine(13) synthase TruD [bacterium]|nr:tRNA pseudouridine(13) synthase TruD [bacterium]